MEQTTETTKFGLEFNLNTLHKYQIWKMFKRNNVWTAMYVVDSFQKRSEARDFIRNYKKYDTIQAELAANKNVNYRIVKHVQLGRDTPSI